MLIVRSVTCVAAILTALAYARWHFWWRSGTGRARMALLVAIALRYGGAVGESLVPGGLANHFLEAGRMAGTIGILLCVLYLAYVITGKNITRIRHPPAAAEQARQHLERTPWATQQDIEKLMACWEETHSPGPARGD